MAEPDGGGISVAPVVRLFQALSPADMDQWKVRASAKHVATDYPAFLFSLRRVSGELVRIECVHAAASI